MELDGNRSNPRWPGQLKEAASELRASRDEATYEAAAERVWKIVHLRLSVFVKCRCDGEGDPSFEYELEDLVEEKALGLVHRMASGKIDFSDSSPGQVYAFVLTVANNLLSDYYRKARRASRLRPEEVASDLADDARTGVVAGRDDSPDSGARRQEYVSALLQCLDRLPLQSQLVWYLRVMCEMSSRDISGHPSIQERPSYVDVVLHRSRRAMGICMHRKGFEPRDMPRGTFTALWTALRRSRIVEIVE